MDYGTFQGVYTLILMAIFIGIIVWAYSKRQKRSFNEAANLVFADETVHSDSLNGEQKNKSARI
ncbi:MULTISPECIES: CcoQ/FixQ family Cbb3-type cytochrome c oxidase assembly chaperone [Moritella]|uniref:Cbb3-type cytochrome oxidase, subunit 3 n=1 Tax=Moritella viscosa TaxID=80854 RepID=A0A090IJ51_9GAMM|nr:MULTISPECIES: CcoQ/FixQ family Cbb3-type cytochrome c oxidase assembly chaperone [Moritella]KXO13431.1 Cytochrome c oxidase subunit CcoQ [Moritella sp. JT01]CED60194.1 Cbb3-type cytochrome c oxidase, subunit IV [Moritella viscosa]SGY98753.1 Putative Cbb3-type cytochrome oxidase, subunit 3 [Moritella viscosa]SGZ05711.1 Putative Cbb3-type cytochrome oxidase, subunit 3 [Moritella viscosa]SGZ05881.1 Putative Cbb3-type cytochrome oxidase, subunit 3 [Moritella viscosa]